MERSAVTLRDVARHLGVSHTTVSNAYNRPEKLSGALRTRILETAQRLGYAGPDPLAAGLAARRVGAVGVLFDEDLSYALTDPAALLFLRGVARAGGDPALGLTLLPAPASTEGADNPVAEAVRRAVVDGFLVYSVHSDHPGLAVAVTRGLPLVVVDEPEPSTAGNWPFLGVDDYAGARRAAEHLVGLGHRRIAVVTDPLAPDGAGGPVDADRRPRSPFQVGQRRLAGYLDVLAEAGIDPGPELVQECRGGTPEHADEATRALLVRPAGERPTAVLAMTDELARGVLLTAAALGLTVPVDLSVVGFDDVPEAARTRPALTTVRQPLLDKGILAMRMLVEAPVVPYPHRRLPVQLIVRESTGPPPPGGG